MKNLKLYLIGMFTLALVSCGGGGGGSGSGGGGSTVYSGTESLTLSSPGVPSETALFGITITISGNTVTITDADGTSGSAPISADKMSFIVPVRFPISTAGVTCSAEIVHSGAISGPSISGTLSGNTPCSGGGISFTITSSGTFSATQTGTAKHFGGPGFAESIITVIQ